MYEKIIELCTENNITVTALEAKLGFGRATISKWKESSPSVQNLKRVADYFGVSVDYLIEEGSNENGRVENLQ